jgi:hypothetical protein
MSVGNWYPTTPVFLFSSFFTKFFFLTVFPFLSQKTNYHRVSLLRKLGKKCNQKENTGKKERKRKNPRTSITRVVNDRIRRRMRSYTVVYGVNYDRIRPYFVVLLDARITTVSRRVVCDHRIRPPYTITVYDGTLSYTTSFTIVFAQVSR